MQTLALVRWALAQGAHLLARRCRGGGHVQLLALVPWTLAQGTCSPSARGSKGSGQMQILALERCARALGSGA